MSGIGWALVVTAVVVLPVAGWMWRNAGVEFRMIIRNGRVIVRRGRPLRGFVSACKDVVRMQRIESGRIEGLKDGRLRFSPDVPVQARQPIRNVWTPPPTGGGPDGRRRRAGG